MADQHTNSKSVQGKTVTRDEPQSQVESQGQSPAHDIRRQDGKQNPDSQSNELNGGQPQNAQQQADQNENGERFATFTPTSYQLGADDQEPIQSENPDSDA